MEESQPKEVLTQPKIDKLKYNKNKVSTEKPKGTISDFDAGVNSVKK